MVVYCIYCADFTADKRMVSVTWLRGFSDVTYMHINSTFDSEKIPQKKWNCNNFALILGLKTQPTSGRDRVTKLFIRIVMNQ